MIALQEIRLAQFRNFRDLHLKFQPGLNAIIGPNAIGKTTILEAIHFLSIGRSFRTTKLQEVIQKGSPHFAIHATFLKDDAPQTLSIVYDGTKKEIKHNETRYSLFSPLLGLFPTVVYSPFDIELIHGSPQIRRRFLNILIAQANPRYAHHLFRYTAALKQRNALLRSKTLTTIEIWEEELIKTANILQNERTKAIGALSPKAIHLYQELSSTLERLTLTYKPSLIDFAQSRERDLLHGYTLMGPHRDDLEFLLNDLEVRNYASEGQKRTCIAALKLAETEYLTPSLLLIDDFGIHLDEHRKQKLEEKITCYSQTFLTSPYQPLTMITFPGPEIVNNSFP